MIVEKAPALFVGHGSPMNAIEDNSYAQTWETIAKTFPKPKGILTISAHWYTRGIRTNDLVQPKMVYDMYGFPEALYQVQYNAPGMPDLAHRLSELLSSDIKIDNTWGFDHGTWSVLRRMYPNADIPVLQLSINGNLGPEDHYALGKALRGLREEGILIFGSGNVVHNLGRVNWDIDGGYPWAEEFDTYIKEAIISRNHEKVIQYQEAGASSKLAFTTPDHFYPLLYVLAASDDTDRLEIFNDGCALGSLSMTSYLFK